MEVRLHGDSGVGMSAEESGVPEEGRQSCQDIHACKVAPILVRQRPLLINVETVVTSASPVVCPSARFIEKP